MKVLYIDDTPSIPTMHQWSEWAGLPVEWLFVVTPEEGLAKLAQQGDIGLVLMDGHLITTTGDKVVQEIRAGGSKTPICMFSADQMMNSRGKSAGAEFSVDKKEFMEEYVDRFSDKRFPEMEKLAIAIQYALLMS